MSPSIHPRTIAEVKEKVDIVDVISEHVVLKKKGKEFVGICPFHDDKKPSMTVSPAKQFYYSPYHHIFSRIGNQDNLFKGQSSFAVEMSELRTILKRSDKNSLILGDELCCGTESISALSIVSATVIQLAKRNASFIFATHLHKLMELSIVKNITNLQIKHLKITYENNCIIYNRILEDGNGSQEYGIMVASTLELPDDVLKYANSVRNEIKSDINIFNDLQSLE